MLMIHFKIIHFIASMYVPNWVNHVISMIAQGLTSYPRPYVLHKQCTEVSVHVFLMIMLQDLTLYPMFVLTNVFKLQ